MHDTAKRGVVFAVATGGLLLAGAAQASAEAAVAIAEQPGGPAATQLEPGVGLPTAAHALEQAHAAASRSQGSTPLAALNRDDAAGPGHSAGILSGDTIDIPAALSLNVCGNGVALLGNTSTDSTCSSSTPGTVAAATAAGSVVRRSGLLSDVAVRAPLSIPVNVCGNLVAIAAKADSGSGSTCTAGPTSAGGTSAAQPSNVAAANGGEAAAVVDRILGGVLSAVTVQAPITVPVNFCGNTVGAGGTSTAAVTCSSGQSAVSSSAGAPTSGDVTGNRPQSSSTALALPATASNCPAASGAGSALAQALESLRRVTTTVPAAPQQAAAPAPMAQPIPVEPIQARPIPAAVSQAAAPAPVLQLAAPSVETSVVGKARPNAALGQKPLTVHPMVVWPRPESASLMRASDGPAHLADPRHASSALGDSTLAQTGARTAIPVGAAAVTLTGGIGLRALGRQGRGSRRATDR